MRQGEAVFRQGEPGLSLYTVDKGELDVVKEHKGVQRTVASLSPGTSCMFSKDNQKLMDGTCPVFIDGTPREHVFKYAFFKDLIASASTEPPVMLLLASLLLLLDPLQCITPIEVLRRSNGDRADRDRRLT